VFDSVGKRVFPEKRMAAAMFSKLFVVGLFLGGSGVIAWGGVFGVASALGALLTLIGTLLMAVGLFVTIWYPSLLVDFYCLRKIGTVIRLRQEAWVQPDQADVALVMLTRRHQWPLIRENDANDVGLLRLDPDLAAVVIEADGERFRIPLGAILACEAERFHYLMGPRRKQWLVRLEVQTPKDKREILLNFGHTDFKPRDNARRYAIASQFCERVRLLLGQGV
jgi:hypothetical protein